MKVFYCGIEAYESRYSHQLLDWNLREFKRLNVPYHIVTGQELPSVKGKIVNGSVLDAHGRTYYSMTQMANLVALMKAGKVTSEDVVFFEDMFTPGIESLPYIMDQVSTEYRPRVYVRCLAQTIDPDDFVNREGMFRWMRPFENMVDSFVSGILVASEEMVANLRIAGFKAPIYVTGLPFGKEEVRSRIKNVKPFHERDNIVSFAARWDDEKQPLFFLEVMNAVAELGRPDVKFQVLTGHPKLKSNNPYLLDEARRYARRKNFKIYQGLSKNEYYQHLADSKILFNCALQDWVSNTVSEADTFGTRTLYPAYRSFPEVFANDARNMYIPWSVHDAATKLIQMLDPEYDIVVGRVSDIQDCSIQNTIDIFYQTDQGLARNNPSYRKNVAVPKWYTK